MECEYNVPDPNSNEAGKGWRFCKKDVTHYTSAGDMCKEHAEYVRDTQDEKIRPLKKV